MQFTKNYLFILLICLGINNPVFANVAKDKIFFEPQSPIILRPQDANFIIQLKANPSTGYQWSITDYPKQWLILVKYTFIPAAIGAGQLIGASGIANWGFRVADTAFTKPRILKIHYLYARPWNLQDHATERVVTLIIQPENSI